MALRNPDIGDIAPVLLRDAVVARLQVAFPRPATKEIRGWRGPVNAATIREFSAKAPAIVITFESIERFDFEGGGQLQVPLVMAATFITKPREHGDNDDASAAMAFRFMRILGGNSWGLDGVDVPEDIHGTNAFDPKVGTAGVNIWVVKWCQVVRVDVLTNAELNDLPDLEQIFMEYRQANPDAPGLDRSSDFPA